MMKWLRRLRGAIGMGVTWAIAWALVGITIGLSTLVGVPMDWFTNVFDAPLPALAVPGFFAGAAFSLVLGIAGRRRRFDELSLPWFSAWGAVGGLLLSAIPMAAATGGGLTLGEGLVAIGTLTLLSAGSAAGSLVLARRAEVGQLPGADAALADVGLTDAEKRELLGKRR